MTVRDFFSRLKVQKNITTEELSSIIGVKYNTITTILAGETVSLSKENSNNIIQGLGITNAELLYNVYIDRENERFLSEEALWYLCEQEALGLLIDKNIEYNDFENSANIFSFCGLVHKKRSVIYNVVDDWNILTEETRKALMLGFEEYIPEKIILGYALYKLSFLSDKSVNKYVIIFNDEDRLNQIKRIIPKKGIFDLRLQLVAERNKRGNIFFVTDEDKEPFYKLFQKIMYSINANENIFSINDIKCVYRALKKCIPLMDDELVSYAAFRISTANKYEIEGGYKALKNKLFIKDELIKFLDKLIEELGDSEDIVEDFRLDYLLMPLNNFVLQASNVTINQYDDIMIELQRLFIKNQIHC